jgi:hypothetical protein
MRGPNTFGHADRYAGRAVRRNRALDGQSCLLGRRAMATAQGPLPARRTTTGRSPYRVAGQRTGYKRRTVIKWTANAAIAG